MFNSFFSLGNIVGVYSGSPLVAAVSSGSRCISAGRPVPCDEVFSFLGPLFLILAPILIFIVLIGIAISVLMIVSWWKLFEKAGRPGWAAIIPIYNIVVMLQIVELSPWLVLVMFIPWLGGLAFFIVSIFMYIRMSKLFGKDEGFAVGLILLPIVFIPILAFGQAQFRGKKPASPVPPTPPVAPSNPVPQTNIADQTKPTDIV